MTTRVLLIEDHPLIVEGLRAHFGTRGHLEVVGHAPTLKRGRELLATTSCDVVVLDLQLPDGPGIELLQASREMTHPPAFLILSNYMTPEYVSTAIALGASGFLRKTSPPHEILQAVETVAEGGLAFTSEQLRVSRNASWAPLTARERDILDGIMRGRSNDEIAAELSLSKKTVEGYLARLFVRYDALTRTELALEAERRHLLEMPTRPNRQ